MAEPPKPSGAYWRSSALRRTMGLAAPLLMAACLLASACGGNGTADEGSASAAATERADVQRCADGYNAESRIREDVNIALFGGQGPALREADAVVGLWTSGEYPDRAASEQAGSDSFQYPEQPETGDTEPLLTPGDCFVFVSFEGGEMLIVRHDDEWVNASGLGAYELNGPASLFRGIVLEDAPRFNGKVSVVNPAMVPDRDGWGRLVLTL